MQNVLEMAALGESASQKTHSLTYLLTVEPRGGSRRGLSYSIIQYNLFSYLAWLRNKGVRIIEVLLYSLSQSDKVR